MIDIHSRLYNGLPLAQGEKNWKKRQCGKRRENKQT